jgi:hypothetical protein
MIKEKINLNKNKFIEINWRNFMNEWVKWFQLNYKDLLKKDTLSVIILINATLELFWNC